MKQNVIQLFSGMALVVDDDEFFRNKKKFTSIFSFLIRFLVITDTRGHKITIRKKDILLFEESYEKEKEETI